MDTVTHALVGWLAGRAAAFPDEAARREGTAAIVAGAVFPDADHAASLFGSELYLRVHRGLSHSLFAVPLTSLLLSFVFYRFGRWKDLQRTYLLALAGQLSHVALDLLNSYGTQVFQPFSDARLSFDVLFVVDLAFTGIVVLGIALSRGRPRRARAAIGALALYVAIAAGFHLRAEGIVREAAKRGGVAVVSSFALPRLPTVILPADLDLGLGRRAEAAPLADLQRVSEAPAGPGRDGDFLSLPFPAGPLAWNGFVDDGKSYLRGEVAPLLGEVRWRQRVARGRDVSRVRALTGLPEVRTFLWFARFPTAAVSAGGKGTTVTFYDLRFAGLPGRVPFGLTVIESPGRPPQARWGF